MINEFNNSICLFCTRRYCPMLQNLAVKFGQFNCSALTPEGRLICAPSNASIKASGSSSVDCSCDPCTQEVVIPAPLKPLCLRHPPNIQLIKRIRRLPLILHSHSVKEACSLEQAHCDPALHPAAAVRDRYTRGNGSQLWWYQACASWGCGSGWAMQCPGCLTHHTNTRARAHTHTTHARARAHTTHTTHAPRLNTPQSAHLNDGVC